MTIIILAMAAGILVGGLKILSYEHRQQLNHISKLALFIMLFCLAAKIGCDKELLSNLGSMWHQSFILAIGILLGSIAGVYIVRTIFSRTLEELMQEEDKS